MRPARSTPFPACAAAAALFFAALASGCAAAAPLVATPGAVPSEADWTDYGTVLEAGRDGAWDRHLHGGLAAGAVRRNGTTLLFYQGACCEREADDTVTERAIGLATSADGVTFAKHPRNPVLRWSPNGNGEEGAVSCGVTLDADGAVVLHYGANTEETALTVNADARLALAPGGDDPRDAGLVLDHGDPGVWGSGDELFPIITIEHEGRWFVYYLPNGTRDARTLGVAWGPRRDRLTKTSAATSAGRRVAAWGSGSAVRLEGDTYALFLGDVRVPHVEVRSVSLSRPDRLSAPLATYRFPGVGHAIVLLDEARRTWFLYDRRDDPPRYGLRLAPAGARDESPPSAPRGVTARQADGGAVELSWEPARDDDTGVAAYRVYRGGRAVALVTGRAHRDGEPGGGVALSYEVSAVNLHGVEGPRSDPATLPDDR